MATNNIQTFIYQDTEIEFDLSEKNLMVNATEMAKPFGKNVANYFRNESTQEFIKECLNNANSHYLKVEKQDDLFISRQNSGTWMHRILAYDFAAWLSPAFRLWMYKTIDEILNQPIKEVKVTVSEIKALEDSINERAEKFRKELEGFTELENDRKKLLQLKKLRSNQIIQTVFNF